MLLVNLSSCRASMLSLITELDSHLCASFPTLRRLNPELVRPSNRSFIGSRSLNWSNLFNMNSKYVVACITFFCLDVGGVWTSTGAILTNNSILVIKILAHCQSPCADFTSAVTSPVGVDTISCLERPCRPCTKLSITHILTVTLGFSGITIVGQHLEPCNGHYITSIGINLKALPFDGSSSTTGLGYEVTRRATDAGVLPLYLNEVIALRNRDRCTSLLAFTPTPTHVDVDVARF